MATAALLWPADAKSEAKSEVSSGYALSVLALLRENDNSLKEIALNKLMTLVDSQWAAAGELIGDIESLTEDPTFQARELASAVASKVYYHLEEYGDALRLALGSGRYFNINSKTDYVETIVARGIDEYIKAQVQRSADDSVKDDSFHSSLETIVNHMFSRCWAEGSYKHALGVALESYRLDIVEETIRRAVSAGCTAPLTRSVSSFATSSALAVPSASNSNSNNSNTVDFLTYSFDVISNFVAQREFRNKCVKTLVNIHLSLPDSLDGRPGTLDHLSLIRCLEFLGDYEKVGEIMKSLLVRGCANDSVDTVLNSTPVLIAFQAAFDLVEADNKTFISGVYKSLGSSSSVSSTPVADSSEMSDSGSNGQMYAICIRRLKQILDGSVTNAMALDFLSSNNKTDPLLLKVLKGIPHSNGVLHSAALTCHSLLQMGTTNDDFVRTNLDWMRKAALWARFSAVAGNGSIHRLHSSRARTVLRDFLPQNVHGVSQSNGANYATAGALYALGLINADVAVAERSGFTSRPELIGVDDDEHSSVANGSGTMNQLPGSEPQEPVISYLLPFLEESQDEVVQHGAALGVGISSISVCRERTYNIMKDLMYQDKAVAGEAAAFSIGMMLYGRGPTATPDDADASTESVLPELLEFARDTKHEKMVRGASLAVALILAETSVDADRTIAQMAADENQAIRYGAMYAIGLAYAATGASSALKRLLHVAVSDVSDDVRRAAVTNLGFLFLRAPAELPAIVAQLAESYNAHVRYGAAMALGIACAGTALPTALAIVEPLLQDSADFVRQAAFISLGLMLQTSSEGYLPKTREIFDKMLEAVSNRHQSSMTKMGALMGLGLMNVAGGNGTLALLSAGGELRRAALVGMTGFLQYWYWFPLTHMISLAVKPATLTGVTGDFKLPKGFGAVCEAPESWFAYPKPMEEKKEDKKGKLTSVQLSTKAKARARSLLSKDKEKEEKEKEKEKEKEREKDKEKEREKEKKKDNEPQSFVMANPSRATPTQMRFVTIQQNRYQPIRRDAAKHAGIVVLKDSEYGMTDEDLKNIQTPADEMKREPKPPATFEWTLGDYF